MNDVGGSSSNLRSPTAGTLILASHALASGPLAASQPGFTILDPLWASLLGLFLYGERIHAGVLDLVLEALALALIIAGVSALSHSHLVAGENRPPSGGTVGHQTKGTVNGPARLGGIAGTLNRGPGRDAQQGAYKAR